MSTLRPVYSTLFFSGDTLLDSAWHELIVPDSTYVAVVKRIYTQIPSGVSPYINQIWGVWDPFLGSPTGRFQMTNYGVDAYANAAWEGTIVIPESYVFGYLDLSEGGQPATYVGGYKLSTP